MSAPGCNTLIKAPENRASVRLEANLIKNPGMENGSSSPDNWGPVSWNNGENAPFEMTWDKTRAYQGTHSLRIKNTGLGFGPSTWGSSEIAWGGWHADRVPIDPDRTYLLTFWVLHEDTDKQPNLYIHLDFRNEAGDFVFAGIHHIDIRCNGGKWQQVRQTIARPDTITATPSSPIVSADLNIYLKQSEAEIWLDDVEFSAMKASDMDLSTKYVYWPMGDIVTTQSPLSFPATGQYALTEDQNNRWWLVNPGGKAFFDVSVDAWPPDDWEGGEFYDWLNSTYGGRTNYYLQNTIPRCSAWGFTSQGAWSSLAWSPWMYDNIINDGYNTGCWKCMKYGANINNQYHVKDRNGNTMDDDHGIVDPFNSHTLSGMQSTTNDVISTARSWMTGYYVDNELSVNQLVYYLWSDTCKTEMENFLQTRYGTITALNTAWDSSYADFSALTAAEPQPGSYSDRQYKDTMAFAGYLFATFHELGRQYISAIDPGKPIFSNRFDFDPNDLVYVDALTSMDGYAMQWASCRGYLGPSPKAMYVANMAKERGLVTVISEWHVGAQDAGLWKDDSINKFHDFTDTQYERGVCYREMIGRLSSHPSVIGATWYRWYDRANGGWWGNNGLVGSVGEHMDQPWQPFIDMLSETHHRLANLDPASRTWDGLYPPGASGTTSSHNSGCGCSSSTAFLLIPGIVFVVYKRKNIY